MSAFDRVWIALHGPGGEDGTLQGPRLEYLGVALTRGSGVMGSCDRHGQAAHPSAWRMQSVLPRPDYVVFGAGQQDFEIAIERLRCPDDREACDSRLERGDVEGPRRPRTCRRLMRARRLGSRARCLRKPGLRGKEYTVCRVAGPGRLPSIRIETPKTFL